MARKPPTPPAASLATHDFLTVHDFDGTYQPKPVLLKTVFGGESRYQGKLLFLNLARKIVDPLVPVGWHIAPNSSAMSDVHPVILLLGRQTATKWIWPLLRGKKRKIGQPYNELILLIPFVRRDGDAYWHHFVARIYLDCKNAEWLGNYIFGFRKRYAGFKFSVQTVWQQVTVIWNAIEMFRLRSRVSGKWFEYESALAGLSNFAHAAYLLNMPILSINENVLGQPKLCSYFEFDWNACKVRQIETESDFLQSFGGPEMDPWVHHGVHHNVTESAFEIEHLRWRLATPPIWNRLMAAGRRIRL